MKKIIVRLTVGLFSMGIIGGIIGISILVYFSFDLPKISSLNDYKPAIPSKILSRDGTVLADLGKENREVAEFDEIPKRIVDAFLSAEDDSFYQHRGVDYMGLFRAFIANLKAGRVVQGGSTITQQVAKSLLLSRERSLSRKIKDFLLAQRIEEKFTKEEILYLYLNQVYLGGGYYGVKSAFEGYFGKSLSEATVAEASQVAGLLVAPGKYSPYVNPKRAKIRQHYVLKRMHETGKITQEEYEKALKEKIKFRIRKPSQFKAGHFTDWVRQRVVSLVGNDEFLREGYTVQTTLDYSLQKVAKEAVLKTVKDVDKRQGFKGPIGHIELEKLDEHRKKFLVDFYKDESTYFTLNDEDEKVYEVEYDEKELESIKEYALEFQKEVKDKRFQPGLIEDQKLLEFVKVGANYNAVVTYVDDFARLIYVDVGGLSGIIPAKEFSWAHERVISEEPQYFRRIQRPSQIVKPGDIVLVKLLDKKDGIARHAYNSFIEWVNKKDKKKKGLIYRQNYLVFELDQEPDAEGALVSMHPDTGELYSLVGGADFQKSQFNRALQSKRQPGSAFKPILFAAALENGYNPSSIIIDSPETLGGVDETLNWKPRNYDGKFKGPTTLRNSLEHSRNVPTVKIASDLGVQRILDFVDRIGFNAKLDEDLSLALGSFGVTLMDIVSTYAIFPNGGKKIEPKTILSITDRFGNPIPFDESYEDLRPKAEEEVVVAEETPEPTVEPAKEEEKPLLTEEEEKKPENPFLVTLGGDQVYDERLAYLMTNLLKGVVQYGTGRGARYISNYIGGKTGTTNNYVDAWFLGFSQNLVTGVWTGFDENQTLGWGETGAKAALPVWREYMDAGLKKYGEIDFRPPPGIVNVLVDKETGKPVPAGATNGFMESFAEGTEPGAVKETELSDRENSNGVILEEDEYYTNQ